MSKKVVGLIVTSVIVAILFLAVLIGGARLEKSNTPQQGVQQRQTTTSRNNTQQNITDSNYRESEGSVKDSESSSAQTETKELNKEVSANQKGQQLVEQAVKESKQVNTSQTEDPRLLFEKSEAKLQESVYEMNGTVTSIELLSSNNGVQAQYKVGIEIRVGSETFTLDYFTTIKSITALKNGIDVIVEYQITTDKEIVIRSIRLKD